MSIETMIKASDEAPSDSKSATSKHDSLTRQEIISNSFIFFLAGHETTANVLHFSMIDLAMNLPSQRRMQADIDAIAGNRPSSEWSYIEDMPRLYNSMVGAVLNEVSRLIPAIPNIPKTTVGDQIVTIDGQEFLLPDGVFIHINTVGTQRNPRYYPHSPSKITGKEHDLDDFVPERWLPSKSAMEAEKGSQQLEKKDEEAEDGLEKVSFETSGASSLFKPVKGAFVSFSEGPRSCPGRRFTQVEVMAVLAKIFSQYSVELDVCDWASDEEVEKMSKAQKREVYQKALDHAHKMMRRCEQYITLRLKKGDKVPLRFVERGRERFVDIFD